MKRRTGHRKSNFRNWLLNILIERREEVQRILLKGVEHCPQAEVLWLMAAKEKWLHGDVAGAQAILAEAFKQNEDSESIFLAAAKLASETGQADAARQILEKARAQADTERVGRRVHDSRRVMLTRDRSG